MKSIKVQYFGPIKSGYQENDGWIDLKHVTVFIGNQGSGKSTLAKLVSTLSWIEKGLYKGDLLRSEVTRKSKFQNNYCAYQGLKSYFQPSTEIEYKGESYHIKFKNNKLSITEVKGSYVLPKIMYVPAERNFVSAVSQPEKLKYLPKPLFTFLEEYERAKSSLSQDFPLPIGNLSFRYEEKKNLTKIVGTDHEVPLNEASSGIQSVAPLLLVSQFLSKSNGHSDNYINSDSVEENKRLRERVMKILLNEKITEDVRNSALEILSSISQNGCFINIVEEPEQNLFPDSQWEVLKYLLRLNNINERNELLMTTHSPYIVSFLSVALQAASLYSKSTTLTNQMEVWKKIDNIIPLSSTFKDDEYAIYQMSEVDGSIHRLPSFEGIPSDNNYLNNSLAKSNLLFSELLEIEDEL